VNGDPVDNQPIRVLLVDDHPLMLDAIESRLLKTGEVSVVGRAHSGEEALEQVAVLHPDLVLTDLSMPGMGGLATIRKLKEDFPGVAVIVLTVSESRENLLDAVLAGAAGYLTKDTRPELLLDAIRAIGEGASILPTNLLRNSVESLRGKSAARSIPTPLKEPLTEREAEVLALLAQGYPNKEIGEALTIVEATVKKHVHNIIRKLEVSDRTQAVVTSIRLGLVTP